MTFMHRHPEVVLWNTLLSCFWWGPSKEGLGLPCVFSTSLGLCPSATPGTEVGTSTSFHLIISFVLKSKSSQGPGGKKKRVEEQGTLCSWDHWLILGNDIPPKHFVETPSLFLTSAMRLAFGGVPLRTLEPSLQRDRGGQNHSFGLWVIPEVLAESASVD